MRAALLLAILLIPSALALTPLDASTMDARVLITNTLALEPLGAGYRVDDAHGTLSWYPREDPLQEVLSLEVAPAGRRTDGSIEFSWDDPSRTETISLNARIRTRNSVFPVRERIPFPLENVPEDIQAYLAAGEITDQSAEIRRLAQEIADGNEDAYEVVYALADWTTTNVHYSLASLGQPAIQRSSQVLASRQGKCDELTALFISMNRALGIPARFVAGYAYTDSGLLAQEWGGHGWAEVWLPGQGWVPFDVTYGEYGYLDAGHVKLKTSMDAKETSIDYIARGNDFRISTEPLDIYVTPTSLSTLTDHRIDITLDAPYRTAGFGSVILILATVRNTKDYYVATRLDLAQTTNTEMLSENYRNLLLKPLETRTVPFLVRIDTDLDPQFTYSFPFKLSSRLGEEQTISITVRANAPIYTESDFAESVERYATTSLPRAPFSVTCDTAVAYLGTDAEHACTVDGEIGETLEVCNGACTPVQLDGRTFRMRTTHGTAGMHTEVYTALSDGNEASFFVTSRFLRPSDVRVAIAAPARATPDDALSVRVLLNHTGAMPRDIEVRFLAGTTEGDAATDDLAVPATFEFILPGRSLRPGENRLEVHVTYVDELGTQGSADGTATVLLEGVSFSDRIYFWFADAGAWLEGLVT